MRIRPTIDIQPQGPGKRYCCWTKGEGLSAKTITCKRMTILAGHFEAWCRLFDTPCFRDDRNRVLRCPQCVQADKEGKPALPEKSEQQEP